VCKLNAAILLFGNTYGRLGMNDLDVSLLLVGAELLKTVTPNRLNSSANSPRESLADFFLGIATALS